MKSVRIYEWSYRQGEALIDTESMMSGMAIFWHQHVFDWLREQGMIDEATNRQPRREWVWDDPEDMYCHARITFDTEADAIAFKLRWADWL